MQPNNNLKPYLPYYLGQRATFDNGQTQPHTRTMELTDIDDVMCDRTTCVLHLRPISDMSEDEGEQFALLCMDSKHHLEADSRISMEEMDIKVHRNDGGNLIDGDVLLYIEVSVRCFEGAIIIRDDMSIGTWDDEEEKEGRVDDIGEKVMWLCQQGFDLFNLIPAGLAVKKEGV